MDADDTGALAAMEAENARSIDALHRRLDDIVKDLAGITTIATEARDESRLTNGRVREIREDLYGPEDPARAKGEMGALEQHRMLWTTHTDRAAVRRAALAGGGFIGLLQMAQLYMQVTGGGP